MLLWANSDYSFDADYTLVEKTSLAAMKMLRPFVKRSFLAYLDLTIVEVAGFLLNWLRHADAAIIGCVHYLHWLRHTTAAYISYGFWRHGLRRI